MAIGSFLSGYIRNQDSSVPMVVTRLIVRFLQFVLAITVAGLYGVRVHAEHNSGNSVPTGWLFAVVTAGLSALTTLVYCVPKVKAWKIFFWDYVLFIFWVGVFGSFAKIYIHLSDKQSYQGTNTSEMKNAVWIDLLAMILWFCTATFGLFKFLKQRKANKASYAEKWPGQEQQV